MDFRTATRGDLAKVFRENAERMRIEYEIAGYNQREAKSILTRSVDAGQAHAFTEANEPVGLIAWTIENGIIQTSFAAKETFFSGRTVRFCYNHIRRIQAENGRLPICSTSFSPHPSVPKWFKTLGLVEGPSEPPYTNYWLMPA